MVRDFPIFKFVTIINNNYYNTKLYRVVKVMFYVVISLQPSGQCIYRLL
jgi:hypothetical protein